MLTICSTVRKLKFELRADCKSLVPTWETLAQDFSLEPGVTVAKVDAEAENSKATAKDQGVKSYPTIKFFPKGSKEPQAYEGGRSEADLVAFLNDKAGTHRTVGGGLDAKAGTIEALDAVVAKLTDGKKVADINEELLSVAKDLKEKYAQYYLRVSEKLGKSEGYVENELARLEGLLKKGGLVREKNDDLVSRSNILRKFKAKTEAAAASIKEEL